MSSSDVLTKQDDIDVVGMLAALRRNLWLIILITIVAGAALFFGLLSISPRYLSTAEVLIQSKTSTAIEQIQEGNNRQVDNRIDERTVRTEVGVLSADKIALDVIDELGLTKLEEFQDESGVSDDLANYVADATLGRPATDKNATLVEDITTDDIARSTALRIFKAKLEVFELENSQVIGIEFWSKNPALARNVVAALTNRYQNSQVTATQETNELAAQFVNPRIIELRKLIADEKKAAAQFESDNQIFKTNNGTGDNPGLLVNQELSEASTELSRVRAEKASAQAKIASIRAAMNSGSSLDVIPEVLGSTYIQSLRQSEVAIEAQISDLSTSLLPQHPRLKALNSQLQRYKSQIRKAAQDIIKSLENNVASTRNAETRLSQEIDQLKNDQLKVNSLLVTLDGYRNNISSYEEELQQRLSEAQQVRNLSDIPPAAATIISPASIPDEPYFPKVVPFTLAGMTATALLTSLAILAWSLITTVSTYQRQENSLGHDSDPVAEDAVAHNQTAPIVTPNDPGQNKVPLGDLERLIFGNVRKQAAKQNNGNNTTTIPNAMAGSEPEEGVVAVRFAASVLTDIGRGRVAIVSPGGDLGSKTAVILARMLSAARKSVIVVDVSGGAATTTEMLGTSDVPGLFNLVTGSVSADQAMFTDRLSDVHILSSGSFAGTTPDDYVIGETIDIIASAYDYCIVDCGDADIDAIDLVSTDDAIIVVSGINARRSDCNALERDLKSSGYADVLHIVPDHQDEKNEALASA